MQYGQNTLLHTAFSPEFCLLGIDQQDLLICSISFLFVEMLTRGYVDVYNMDRLGFSEVSSYFLCTGFHETSNLMERE